METEKQQPAKASWIPMFSEEILKQIAEKLKPFIDEEKIMQEQSQEK